MTSNPSSQVVGIRVLVADTGVTFRISLQPAELTVANIRAHLAAAVPPSDQILLLGPPFKVPRDSTLQSDEVLNALRLGDMEDDPIQEDANAPRNILSTTERSGAKRLYLFSKLALSESAPQPPVCRLEPMDLTLPTTAPEPSPLSVDPASSPPLHQALLAYERQFMLYLSQGRALADGADLRFAACRTCVQEQAVMSRSLRAAVANLSDHFHGAARTRAEFTAAFQAKSAAHGSLLQRFESILSNLASTPLHPSLVSIAQTSGRTMETLLDTVPVDRERTWAQQCQNSHQRLVTLFGELDTAFSALGTPASREEEAKRDREAEQHVQSLWNQVEGTAREIRNRQAERLSRLTQSHGDVMNLIMNAIAEGKEDEVQNAFTPLQKLSTASKDIVPSMVADDTTLKSIMEEVSNSKTEAMKRMRVRLRNVSAAQSSIQRVLSSVGVLRDALAQQTENMVHLEHVAELPESYRAFLSELRRRRAYGHAVTASSTAMMERLAAMRDDEVKAREKFLRGPGRHLMPAFFDIFVPTLATPPPLFTPQLPAMVELDTLPDVGTITTSTTAGEASDAVMQHSTAAVAEQGGVSSASTLTAESHPASQQQKQQQQQQQQQDPMMASAAVASGQDGGGGGTPPPQQHQQQQGQQQQDQLIVSADEQSGDELILDPSSGTAADAEAKTLAYENACLRQALERLGGKPPQAYIEEARAKDGTAANVVDPAEIEALRKELDHAKNRARVAEEALSQASAAAAAKSETSSKKLPSDDKISHSSFSVGDVGLFMPTGRGTGGKRMYLAFHTNCPHRYLSTDCIKGSPDYVLGRIVYQEELIAGEVGTDANPYGLHVGTKFWVLTVEVLKSQS